MIIKKDCIVSIDYTLTDKNGEEIDSSKGQEPLAYLHGHAQIIEGLEKELEGKKVGDELKVKIEPAMGYGEKLDELVMDVPKGNFPDPEELEVGGHIIAETEEGETIYTVLAINEDSVTLDGNHPLAGEELNFEVKVVGVREATAEELTHGHAHGEGGCGHDH